MDEALEVLAKIPQERLGPKETFYKALFLTAVASSNRSSELAAIDRNRIELRQSSIVLSVKPGFILRVYLQVPGADPECEEFGQCGSGEGSGVTLFCDVNIRVKDNLR